MTPRDFRVMVEAKAAQIRQDWKFLDTLTAVQTARLINVQCGTEENPSPATPEMCMVFAWDQDVKEKVEEETIVEDQIQKITASMKNWVASTGGHNG